MLLLFILHLDFYYFFMYFEDEERKWMVIIIGEGRKIIKTYSKFWYFNQMYYKIDNLI